MARRLMLKLGSFSSTLPKAKNFSLGKPSKNFISFSSTNQTGKTSCPAGTGVCVVKTLVPLTTSKASSKVRPSSIYHTILSKFAKAG